MVFNNYNRGIIVRVFLLAASILLLSYLPFQWNRAFTWLVVLLLVGLQILSLIRYASKPHNQWLQFLAFLENADASFHPSKILSSGKIYQKMEKATESFLQSRLREQEQFYLLKHILEKTTTGFMLVDAHMQLFLINEAAQQWFNLEKGDTIGSLPFSWADLTEMAKREEAKEMEIMAGHRKVWLTVSASKIRQGNRWFYLLTLTDMYAQITSKEMKAWQTLTRTLNHEIMNTVTPISSLAETALTQLSKYEDDNRWSAERLRKSLETILSRSRGLYDFVQEFRKLTKAPRLYLVEQQVTQPLREALELLSPRMEMAGIEVQEDVPEKLTKVPIDKRWVVQVFINLLVNAIEAMEGVAEKRIFVQVREDQHTVKVRVQDSGPGIAPEDAAQLFDPFYSTKKHGTGIGLTFSRQVIQLHKGQLFVDENETIGAAFSVVFPK
jgi:nitrogen fixation/metabolism regulation signal transduction histidine kinase